MKPTVTEGLTLSRWLTIAGGDNERLYKFGKDMKIYRGDVLIYSVERDWEERIRKIRGGIDAEAIWSEMMQLWGIHGPPWEQEISVPGSLLPLVLEHDNESSNKKPALQFLEESRDFFCAEEFDEAEKILNSGVRWKIIEFFSDKPTRHYFYDKVVDFCDATSFLNTAVILDEKYTGGYRELRDPLPLYVIAAKAVAGRDVRPLQEKTMALRKKIIVERRKWEEAWIEEEEDKHWYPDEKN